VIQLARGGPVAFGFIVRFTHRRPAADLISARRGTEIVKDLIRSDVWSPAASESLRKKCTGDRTVLPVVRMDVVFHDGSFTDGRRFFVNRLGRIDRSNCYDVCSSRRIDCADLSDDLARGRRRLAMSGRIFAAP